MNSNESFYTGAISSKTAVSGFWSEKVFVATTDYMIKGYVFMPKTGKKNRILSDILNSERRFVAIKNAEISDKRNPSAPVEEHDFIQINLDSIVLIRPVKED
jgi:hypothetical protein